MDKCQYKRRQIKELQHDLQIMKATSEKLEAEQTQLHGVNVQYESEKDGLVTFLFFFFFLPILRKV